MIHSSIIAERRIKKSFYVVVLVVLCLFLLIGCGNSSENNYGYVAPMFSSSDLTGEWNVFVKGSSIYGSIEVEHNGNITKGNWTKIGVASGTFTGGVLLIDQKGAISGFIDKSNGITSTIQSGQINFSKTIIAVATINTHDDYEGFILIKNKGTAFEASDLQGTWYYSCGIHNLGLISVNNFGNMIREDMFSSSGPVKAGSISIDSKGTISGSIKHPTMSTNTYMIQSGQLDLSRNLFITAYIDTASHDGLCLATRRDGTYVASDLGGSFQFISFWDTSKISYGSLKTYNYYPGGYIVPIKGGSWNGWTTYGIDSVELSNDKREHFNFGSNGHIVGFLSTSTCDIHTIQSGQMSMDKEVSIITTSVYNCYGSSESNGMVLLIIKAPL